MANGVLSSYFEKEKAKGSKAGGASPYSAPIEIEPAGPAPGASVAKMVGSAPAGGGGGGATGAPKGSAGGGTGFVSFGQYFGANAPVIQAQAQQAVQPKAPTAQQGAASDSPYAADIAKFRAQSEALNPVAQTGYMGEGTSAFDQLLGGGVTQQAAKQEQQRLGTMRAALEGEQAQYQNEQERQARAARSREASRRRQEERAAQDAAQAAADVEQAKDFAYDKVAGLIDKLSHSRDSYWNSLSEEEKQAMMNRVAQERGDDQYEPEYASVTQ